MKKVSGRLANLTPEQREKLLKKLREQKKEQGSQLSKPQSDLKSFRVKSDQQVLSFSQQRLWFLDQLGGAKAAYNIPASLNIHGKLNVSALKKAFQFVVDRHELLRSTFVVEQGLPRVKINESTIFELLQTDLSALNKTELSNQLERISQAEACYNFSLDKGPLFRARLLNISNNENILIICMHHIISDAWSMRILVKEVSLAYNKYLNNKIPQIPDNELRYIDYSAWQRQGVTGGLYEQQVAFWKEKLNKVSILNFPFDKPRPVEQSYVGKQIVFELPENLSNKLRLIARTENKTLFSLMLAAWKIFLYRYSAQQDICVGTPVANRPHSELENLIGFFVNTLPVRTHINPAESFASFLDQVQKNALAAFENPDVPFERMIDDLGLERDMSQSPVFQTMFSFQNDSVEEGLNFENLSVVLTPIHTGTSKFDLSLDVVDQKKNIKISLEYNSDLLFESSVQLLKENFTTLLDSIALDSQEEIRYLNCLHENTLKKYQNLWSGNKNYYEKQKSISEQFETQVEKNPNGIALIVGNVQLSYEQLNKTANQLARKLQKKGIGKNSLVMLLFNNDQNLIVSLMAAIKVGACYSILDARFSKEFISDCIAQKRTSLLISNKSLADSLGLESYQIEHLFIDTEQSWTKEDSSNIAVTIDSESLLYELFNYDGRAVEFEACKRVAASHRSVSNLVNWYCAQSDFVVEQEKNYLIIDSLAFERSQKNVFASLLSGQVLILLDDIEAEPEHILTSISDKKIHILNCTPSDFYRLLRLAESVEKLSTLRCLFLSGEPVYHKKLLPWLKRSQCKVINCYNVGGCTDVVGAYSLEKNSLEKNSLEKNSLENIESFAFTSLPISKAIPNVSFYLLNNNLQLVPQGVYAELYVAGDALAKVYSDNQADGKAAYIDNPISGESGKLLASGDFARLLHSGDYEIIGSANNFLNIRGYYVDKSRVINAILSLPDIVDAAVIVDRSNASQEALVAFLVLEAEAIFNQDLIQKSLKNLLPDYMLPSNYFHLKALPQSFNKKIDELALQELIIQFSIEEVYWKQKLLNVASLHIPFKSISKERNSATMQSFEFELSIEQSQFLRQYTDQHNLRLFDAFVGIYQILLSKYTAQTDFVIATLPNTDFEKQTLFSGNNNLLAIRSDLKEGISVEYFLKALNETLTQAYTHKNYPLEKLAQLLNADALTNANPVFQACIYSKDQASTVNVNIDLFNCDLVLAVDTMEEKIKAEFFYKSAAYNSEIVAAASIHFLNIVSSFQQAPKALVDELDYLSEVEKNNIVALAQGPTVHYQAYNNVADFLEALPTAYENNKALLFELASAEESITYKDLHEQSKKLALYLQALGLRAQAPVALCLDRGVDMVIAILAVLKAGSPYLPLDPELPNERLKFMLQDSAAQFVLCASDTARRFDSFQGLINLQDTEVIKAQSQCEGMLINRATPSDLFNIIYTSGSTGNPKGVMVTHAGILNRIQWMQAEYQLTLHDRVLQKTTYSFDVSVWEFIWPLSVGAGLVLAKPGGHKDPVYLNELINRFDISHCHFVPSMLWSWLELSANIDNLSSLKKVFCSGEALSREAVNRFYSVLANCELHNLYGPTEASIDVSYWHCEKGLSDLQVLPIGKPVANTQLYVLDKNLGLVKSGVVGELYISGVQLARGYLNREDLNNKTFIEWQIKGITKQRLYKTGDLVRQADNGVIEYLGRIDHQVKIRGYRIELGEIEARLQGMQELALSVVTALDVNGTQKLVAYVSALDKNTDHENLKHLIKQYLAQHLPVYMVPSIIMVLDELPLLENGKINRKRLPALEMSSVQSTEYIAAESALEAELQDIWQSVLGLENVSTRDNFFDLGGDSILSIQIISAARRKNILLSPSQIFRHPTIAELAQLAVLDQNIVVAEQGQVKGKFICSPIQQWFFSNFHKNNHQAAQHFNQSVLLTLKTTITRDTLVLLAKHIFKHHDVLNSQFVEEDACWFQIHGEESLLYERCVSAVSEGNLQTHANPDHELSLYQNLLVAQKSLNIEKGHLIHFRLMNETIAGDIQQSLYIVAHHLVVDGISWRILMDDLDNLLSACQTNENISGETIDERCQAILPEKTLSFKQWTEGLAKLDEQKLLEEDKNYWLSTIDEFSNYQSPLIKKTSIEKLLYKNQKRVGFSLPKALTDKFLRQANRSFRSDANDILLCALFDTLVALTTDPDNKNQLSISLEAHGRDLSDEIYENLAMPDVSRTLGWFTSLFPLLLVRRKSSANWGDKLKDIKEQIRRIPHKGLGFGLLTQAENNQKFSAQAKSLKPDMSFNYLGQFGAEDNNKNFILNTSLRNMEGADYLDQSPLLERAHALDVVIFISDGCLNCDFLYDDFSFEKNQIELYLQNYQQNLEALIVYCCEQNYSSLTPSDLPSVSLTQEEIETIEAQFKQVKLPSNVVSKSDTQNMHLDMHIQHLEIETMHGLLPTQAGMLFHTLYQGASSQESAYFEQFCIKINGPLNISLLEQAWIHVIKTYPTLRSCFYWQFSEFVQVVLKEIEFHVEHHTLPTANSVNDDTIAQQYADLETFLENDKKRGFDLSKAPLMRVSVLDVSATQQWLIWSYHHILLDGWSVPLVLNSLFEHYVSLLEGKTLSHLSNNIYSYENYVAWHKKYHQHDHAFWQKTLEGFFEPNSIELEPVAFPITEELSENQNQKQHSKDESVELSLSFELSQQLREFSRSQQFTLNTLVQGAWALLLSHYSGDDDVIFGATVSGRSEQFQGSENIVGMFINTLPLRVCLNDKMTLLELLSDVQNTQQRIVAHQSNSLIEIQKAIDIDAESALFKSIVVFENFPVSEKLKQDNPWFSVEEFYSYEKTNYPLTISVEPNETLNFRVLFDSKLYRKETMVRLLNHLACLLENFPSSANKNIFEINYISDIERKALDNWNKTETHYPRDSALVELVEQSVAQNPQQIALKFDELSLSYERLNALANQFSAYLMQQNLVKGQRVALFMDRSQELLVSALAVIKTGAAYVPLDPAYPEERLQYMLQDCEPSIIISVSANKNALETALASKKSKENPNALNVKRNIIYLDECWELLTKYSAANPKLQEPLHADDLAYLMYTSGSTGQPKGVCLSHRSIIRLVMNTWYLSLGANDKIGHICNVCFDASAYEIWGALLNGATLIGFDRETILSEDLFAEKLQKESVTNMLMTTSLFHLYSRHRPEIFSNMRCLLIGGEPLHPDAARRVLKESRPSHLMNVYGPTENGVLTTVFDTWNLAEGAKNTPVGKPISNTTVYIVNKRNQEVPVGVVGELVSGGDGVGLGYWKLDDVTAHTFVADPFSKKPNARMYRTGDLARRLPDGSFEVLGRMDDQLKIRGFRIEPSEIVARLNSIDSVSDAVVAIIESEGNKKHLVAYMVPKAGAKLDLVAAKKSLMESLPAHMVPSFLLEIEKIPITPNGKLDKAKLPKPKFDEILRDNYVAPRNDIENELANIWSEVLKITAVGIFDNFFELGGDSIISIQIVSRAKRAGLNITPKLLFEHPNIADLVQHISNKSNAVVAEQGLVSGEVKLTPIQQWFFEQNLNDVDYFNQSLLFDVNGFITVQSITPVVSALLKQHDVLRLRFNLIKNEWVQKHDNSARSLSSLADILSEQNFSHAENPYQNLLKHAELMQSQVNLAKGPLIKIVLYHLGKQGQKLLIIAHHLIMDGVSWRILLDDLNLAMEQQENNQAIDFGEKTTSYQFWSKILHEYAKSEFILSQQAYWEKLLKNAATSEVLNLKQQRQQQNIFEQERISIRLDKTKSAALLRECHQGFRTETQDLLLLALTLALKENALGNNAWISLEGHGRNALKAAFADQVDNSSTLGWFTCIYPVLLELEESALQKNDMGALIKAIKSTLRLIPDQGSSFSLLNYLHPSDSFQTLITEAPVSEISFNYLGQVSEATNKDRLKLDPHYLGSDNSKQNRSKFALNLSAIFQAEQFEFNVNYDTQLFAKEKIESLLNAFASHLNNIIDFCLNENNFGFTPSDLPYFPLEQEELDRICANQALEKHSRLQAIYPLSPMQEGMLFHSRLDKNSGMYCEQVSVLFSGQMKVAAMQQAWNDALARHDILRTSFIWEGLSKPLQLVNAKATVNIQILDWRNEKHLETSLQKFLKEDREKGFDFDEAPLMRLHYIHWPQTVNEVSVMKNATPSLGRFIWTYHHILLDGWSMPLLMREVFERYNALCQSEHGQAKAPAYINTVQHDARYEDYIEWLYTRGGKNNFDNAVQVPEGKTASEQFWLSYLSGFDEPNSLALAKRKSKTIGTYANQDEMDFNQGLQYQELNNKLTEAQTQKLQSLAARHQVTLNTLLQAAWALLLNRYSGEQDIVFGITVSGRPSSLNHIESIIGLFINTVPFRVQVNGKTKLDVWLKSILKNQVQLRQFETTPLVDIQAQSHIDGSRALFDSILVFENYPLDETLAHAPIGLKLEELQVYEQTNFPLSLIILPGKALDIRMLFDTEIFEHQTIEQVLRHLKNLLMALCDVEENVSPETSIELQDINYLSEQEQQLIIQELNNTDRDYPRNDYLQDIVARHAPEKLALISEQENLSFGELEQRASKLAAFICSDQLGESCVNPGDKVVICLNRSTDLIVAILAILKAGASYVPLDPAYPEERQRYMLEDTQTRLIISDAENAPLVKHLAAAKSFRNSINFIDINAKAAAIAKANIEAIPAFPAYIDNEEIPAAILYTSGSTGQPKGVCLSHRGLSRMVLNTNYMQVDEHDRVAHVSNICFDAASFEIWAALLNGLPLVILDRDIMLDLEKFEQELKAKQVSILLITTALFNLVAKEQVSAFENINYLFFGGEACNAGMVKRVFEQAKPKHLMHMYGPSENSTYATWYEVKAIDPDAKTIPIGKAVSNSQVYIMNQQGNLLPRGVAGEIVCAGDGLALGYLNKPEQTQKAFVMRALPGKAPERMYLTGDLGIYDADGNIEILGRIDNQVKIRGHRIEPEEIIARINAVPEIKKAYVLVKKDKEDKKYLVAYFVPEVHWLNEQNDKLSRARELKLKLKSQMPDYMVPSFYVEIEELPLTPNGKIDTKALPEAEVLQSHSEYQAAENSLEQALVDIWQEVLQHKKIGVHDDFFELGGHSLLVTQVHSRIRQQLKIDVPLRTLFELPTIREFSEFWQAIEAAQNLTDTEDDNQNDEDFEEGEL